MQFKDIWFGKVKNKFHFRALGLVAAATFLLALFQNCQQSGFELKSSSIQFDFAASPSVAEPPQFAISNIYFLSGQDVTSISFPRSNQVFSEVSSIEMPPVMLGQVEGINYSFVSSFESFLCQTSLGIFSPNQFPSHSCRLVSTPDVDSSRKLNPFTSSQLSNETAWKRNYSGIFSGHIISSNGSGASLVAIAHYENKGEEVPYTGKGVGPFLTSIGPNMTNTVGTRPSSGNCMEYNGCYFASIGLQFLPTSLAFGGHESSATNDLTDYGPITWPSAGYMTTDGLTKISDGPRHPYSIIKDNYLYVFYLDQIYTDGEDGNYSKYNINDQQAGIKVIRAPVDNLAPSQWRAYFNGKFDQPTLPEGFDAKQMSAFASSLGPKATVIMGENSTLRVSFAVAKIKGTQSFIGVETYIDYEESQCLAPGKYKVALRTSEDLVHWSARKDVYGCLDRNVFGLFYAKFLDATGNSNYEIDPNDFYLIGSSTTLVNANAATSKDYSTGLNVLRLKVTPR